MRISKVRPITFVACILAAHAVSSLRQRDMLTERAVSESDSRTDAIVEEGSEVANQGSTNRPRTSVQPGTRPRHSWTLELLSAKDLRIRETASDFQMYYLSVVSLIGVVTNFLAGVVFASRWKRESQQTINILMIGLSIADTLSLFHHVDFAIYQWTDFHASLAMAMDSGCQIIVYVSNWARDCSSYFILAFTVDRFVAVWFPLKRGILITKTRMLVAMVAIVIASGAAESYMLVLQLVKYAPLPERCVPTSVENGNLWGVYNTIFKNTLGFLVPCTAVAILNALIILRMRQHHAQRASMVAEASSNSAATQTQSRVLTRMLVVVSTFSFACSLPKTVYFIWIAFHGSSTEVSAYLGGIAIDCLSQLNHTSNFFLYCLTGSEFRKDLRKTMIKLCTCKGQYWIDPPPKSSARHDVRTLDDKKFEKQTLRGLYNGRYM